MQDFDKFFSELKKYKEEYGNCNVPQRYITIDGYKLGYKVNYVRTKKEILLSNCEIMMLNALGFEWIIQRKGKQKKSIPIGDVISLYKKYISEHKTSTITATYTTNDGIKLGQAINLIRNGYRKITLEEREILEELGLKFRDDDERIARKSYSTNQIIELIREYVHEKGDCNIPVLYKTEDGIGLGRFAYNIKLGRRRIIDEQRKELIKLGFSFEVKHNKNMDEIMDLLGEYKSQNGNCEIPQRYITSNGICLGTICKNIRYGNNFENKKRTS